MIIGLSQKVTTLEDATLKGSSSIHYGLRIASVDSRGRERGAKLMLAEVDLKDGLVSSYKDEHPTASLDGNERITFAVNDAECAAQAQT
ncbi:MAG: hypothetical protein JNL55_14125 [Steroidobacter sp.]|nr:hypothetical protein [Steroidobacter sp.]